MATFGKNMAALFQVSTAEMLSISSHPSQIFLKNSILCLIMVPYGAIFVLFYDTFWINLVLIDLLWLFLKTFLARLSKNIKVFKISLVLHILYRISSHFRVRFVLWGSNEIVCHQRKKDLKLLITAWLVQKCSKHLLTSLEKIFRTLKVEEKPLSVTHSSAGSRSAAGVHVDNNSSVFVARSGQLRSDAVRHDWNGFKDSFFKRVFRLFLRLWNLTSCVNLRTFSKISSLPCYFY